MTIHTFEELKQNTRLLKTGDIIHVQSQGLISKLIRYFSTGSNEKLSWASHTAMVFAVYESEIFIIEALDTVEIHPITYYEKSSSKLKIMRKPNGLTEAEMSEIKEKALTYFTRKYGYLSIVAHALDRLVNNRYFFRRLVNMENYPICSWLVANCYWKGAGIRLAEPPDSAQPDDIMDYCIQNKWEVVFEN